MKFEKMNEEMLEELAEVLDEDDIYIERLMDLGDIKLFKKARKLVCYLDEFMPKRPFTVMSTSFAWVLDRRF